MRFSNARYRSPVVNRTAGRSRKVRFNPEPSVDRKIWAAVVIIDGRGRVLVLRRGATDPWMPGHWCLPGGGREKNETPQQNALREVKEETGLDVHSMRFIGTLTDGEGIGFFYQAFRVNCTGDVRLDWENDQFLWASPTEMNRLSFVPGAKEVILEALKTAK